MEAKADWHFKSHATVHGYPEPSHTYPKLVMKVKTVNYAVCGTEWHMREKKKPKEIVARNIDATTVAATVSFLSLRIEYMTCTRAYRIH